MKSKNIITRPATFDLLFPRIVGKLHEIRLCGALNVGKKLISFVLAEFPEIMTDIQIQEIENAYGSSIEFIKESEEEEVEEKIEALLGLKSKPLQAYVYLSSKYPSLKMDRLKGEIILNGSVLREDDQRVMHNKDQFELDGVDETTYLTVLSKVALDNKLDYIDAMVGSLDETSADIVNTPNISKLNDILGLTDDFDKKKLRMFLLGMMARAITPGIQVDTALILQGEQGLGKSSFFRALVGDKLFTDGSETTNKVDEVIGFNQHLLVEMAEFETAYSKRDVEALKQFMTRTVDSYRRPYARVQENHQRRFVVCGTTNRKEFLRDETGSRRFMPVEIKKRIDLDEVRKIRDGVLAEAKGLVLAGEKWFTADGSFEKQLSESNIQFADEDPLEENVRFLLDKQFTVDFEIGMLITELYKSVTVGIKESRRVGSILRKLGYVKRQKKVGERNLQIWNKKGCKSKETIFRVV